ncbi:hypothetical protein FGO68_gene9372 [Halteria grandinella]|uniref:Uncharacterized protein n=1 Tax=Halteria grandinella TaxID=5974 RepID=A0A8J8NQT7_HALGN|nr:hypothetical protein FGO68_gene9372 [Halteria grandinella]
MECLRGMQTAAGEIWMPQMRTFFTLKQIQLLIHALQRDFELKEALNAELNTLSLEQNSQVLKLQASLSDAQDQSQCQEREIDKLHQEIENLEDKLKAQKCQEASKVIALTKEIDDLHATNSSIIGQLKRYEDHLRENDYQFQHLKAEKQSLYLQIESLNASFDHSLRQVQSLMKEKLLLEGVLQTLQSKRSPSPKGERNTRQLQMTPSSASAGIKRSGLHIRSMVDLESNVSHEPEAAQHNLMLNNMEIDALSIGDQCDGYHSYRSSCSRAFEWVGPTEVQHKGAALNRKSISPPDTARLSHYTPKQQQITEASESIETSNVTTSQILNTDRSSLLLREKDEECFTIKNNSIIEMLFDNLQPQMLLKKQLVDILKRLKQSIQSAGTSKAI